MTMEKKKSPLNSSSPPLLAEEDLTAVAGGIGPEEAPDYLAMAAAEGRPYRLPRHLGLCECGNGPDRKVGDGSWRFYRESEYVPGTIVTNFLDVKCYVCGRTFDMLQLQR